MIGRILAFINCPPPPPPRLVSGTLADSNTDSQILGGSEDVIAISVTIRTIKKTVSTTLNFVNFHFATQQPV